MAGLTASWWVSRDLWLADIVNLFRPVVLLLAIGLAALAFGARTPALIGGALLLAAANLYLVLQPALELPAAVASGSRRAPASVASFDVVSDESLPDFVEWAKDKKRRPMSSACRT